MINKLFESQWYFTKLMNMGPALWTGYRIRKVDDRVDAKLYQAFPFLIILCPPRWYQWQIMLAILDSNQRSCCLNAPPS